MGIRNCLLYLAALVVVADMIAFAVDAEAWQKILEQNQYKRLHVTALKTALEENWDAALTQAQDLERLMPDDPETAFLHAVIFAHTAKPEEAVAWCTKAIERGMAPGRLACESHNLLAPIAARDEFKSLFEAGLVHGPMLGNLSATGVSLWVRTADAAEVELTVEAGDAPIRSAGTTRAEDDYTAVLRVEGLTPKTEYTYTLRVGGAMLRDEGWRFTTADPDGTALRIAFGGGAGYTPENERMWTTIRDHNPHALLLLGDNVYIDNPTHPEIQRYCYYRRQSRPEFRALVCRVPVYSIWDDHDFGVNDCWYGTDPNVPAWKPDVLRVFTQNWVNPSYGGGAETPGIWYSFERGPVRFVMTDGRYYRSDPEVVPRTMLGSAQKAWLLGELAKEGAPFTVMVSGVPWSPGTKGASLDTWDGFPEERAEIFSAIEEASLSNVLFLAADRHRSDIWKVTLPSGAEVYEFESSRLTNRHVHETMEHAIFSYNAKQSFGMVDFETEGDTRGMRLTVVNIDGEHVYSMHVPGE